MSDLTYQDVLNILRLIDAGPFAKIEIEFEGTRLKVTRRSDGAGAGASAALTGRSGVQHVAHALDAPHGHAPDPHGMPRQGTSQSPAPSTPKNQPKQAAAYAEGALSGVTVKPPMAGTFYAAPAPNADPFVKVDQPVRKGDQLGVVEVMKLFTPVIAPCDGTVSAILVENEAFVQAEQTLMVLQAAV